MAPENAMVEYVALVQQLAPGWTPGSGQTAAAAAPAKRQGGAMGPVVSTMSVDETSKEWATGDDVFYLASTGETAKLMATLKAAGADPDVRDRSGHSPKALAKKNGHAHVMRVFWPSRSDRDVTPAACSGSALTRIEERAREACGGRVAHTVASPRSAASIFACSWETVSVRFHVTIRRFPAC